MKGKISGQRGMTEKAMMKILNREEKEPYKARRLEALQREYKGS